MTKLITRLLTLLTFLVVEVGVLLLVFLSSLVAFFYLTRVVFVQHSAVLDQWGFAYMDQLRAAVPGLTSWVIGITFFASAPFLVGAGVLLPALLAWRQRRHEALEVFWAVAGSAILNQIFKTHFHRLRPDTALFPQMGLSFPSGHAMIGMALYGCLAWLLWRHRRHPLLAVALLLWAVLIGCTRIYLHVHYTTDVLAGFVAGLAWLVLLRSGLHLWWRNS
ncbi:phosphatase PAP2 family protein [Hymenobacter cellulosilyticus]|uniref:Phosphatase PAP2 family protein n=1 Tax=Hymenobacter cellulosilyticus TaxID=2932248 RepID=A0A8T9QAU8_9BACT|nr:phosphatase PAP2 family protein [Hymenobacter cellulosilyticus]UOQ74627.1 phosphatase PAP2 family protein [Hymenobacter cellulosilyticus]